MLLPKTSRNEIDFVIVGAGAAGGVIAKELATAGFRIVVLAPPGSSAGIRSPPPWPSCPGRTGGAPAACTAASASTSGVK
jgi:glycine/D-amino acid oxidase-like deaminating enzyme